MLRVDRILEDGRGWKRMEEDWRGLERMIEDLDFLDFLDFLGDLALYSHFLGVGVLV